MRATVKITGFKELNLNLKELEGKIQRGAMRTAMTKAARLMVAAVKRNAPVGKTGLLKKSIKQKVTTSKKGVVTARIGPSNKVSGQVTVGKKTTTVRPAKYAHLVEFGTGSRGSYGREGVAITPGNPPRPFMRPAYESTREAATALYGKELGPAIEKTAARIGRAKRKALLKS